MIAGVLSFVLTRSMGSDTTDFLRYPAVYPSLTPLIHCVFKGTALNMNVLSHAQKYHGHPRVLTNGNHVLPCNSQIFLKLI